ncbi:MAG: hypothetical protein AB7G28_26620, partial [Pirellulales bacterium]
MRQQLHGWSFLLVALIAATGFSADPPNVGWKASPQAIARASQSKSTANFEESHVGEYLLADPLISADGKPVIRDSWPQRRAELLETFAEQMFGRAPIGRPANESFRVLEVDPHALDGQATRKLIEISFDTPHSGRFAFPLQLYLPNAVKSPPPVALLLQFEGLTDPAAPLVIKRGWALAVLDRTKLAADDANTFRDGVIDAFSGNGPLAPDAWQA